VAARASRLRSTAGGKVAPHSSRDASGSTHGRAPLARRSASRGPGARAPQGQGSHGDAQIVGGARPRTRWTTSSNDQKHEARLRSSRWRARPSSRPSRPSTAPRTGRQREESGVAVPPRKVTPPGGQPPRSVAGARAFPSRDVPEECLDVLSAFRQLSNGCDSPTRTCAFFPAVHVYGRPSAIAKGAGLELHCMISEGLAFRRGVTPMDALKDATGASVSLESVLCTEELKRRPSRPPDYQVENEALRALAPDDASR